jgi:uncharacterized glyoxalase superfamily protein PhnB
MSSSAPIQCSIAPWLSVRNAAQAVDFYAASEGHGWRIGRVVDPFGHHWEIGHPLAA